MAGVTPVRNVEEKNKVLDEWVTLLEEADSKRQWGQVVEAAQHYTRIGRQMKEYTASDLFIFNDHEKRYLQQARQDLHDQAVTLRDFVESKDCNNKAIENIKQVLMSLKLQGAADTVHSKRTPSLVPLSRLSITVERIGLKNAGYHSQPFIKISVLSLEGMPIEDARETSYSSNFEKDYIIFNCDPIRLKTPISQLPAGCAVFFELCHYKHSKRKMSTKCFTFMEQDEFKEGPVALEIYKKPTDVTRKKLNLLTKKDLYLHLTLSFY